MIPDFDRNGNLPAGVHMATWQEFSDRFGFTVYRQELLLGLRSALISLQTAGCKVVYIDGSYVTDKEIPADFDGCWDTNGVDKSLVDPILLDFRSGRWAQKAKYHGELFPASFIESMSGQTFLNFFMTDKRTGSSKGIIALDLQRERL
jgi:hypothetical protein